MSRETPSINPEEISENPKGEQVAANVFDWEKENTFAEEEIKTESTDNNTEKVASKHDEIALRIEELSRIEVRTDFSATLTREVEEVRKLNSGETKITASQLDILISSFESYETRITVINGSWGKEGEVSEEKVDPNLSGNIARDIDALYGEESFLTKNEIMDQGHVEVLGKINSYVMEQAFVPSTEEHQTNVDYIRNKRNLLSLSIENIDQTARYKTDQLDTATDLSKMQEMLAVYDRLLGNLEEYGANISQKSPENREFNLYEYKLSIIRAIIAELTVWKMEILKSGSEPDPLTTEPEPTPEPISPEPISPANPEKASPEKILIADVSEILKSMAWRIAENRLNEIVNANSEPGPVTRPGFRGFLDRVGAIVRRPFTREGQRASLAKLGEQGYLVKFYHESLEAIENDQNLRTDIEARLWGDSEIIERGGPGNVETYEVLDAVISQMEMDVLEREERGENLEESGQYFTDIFQRHLLGEFADRAEFEAAVRETINDLIGRGIIAREQFTNDEGRIDEAEGLMFASNLWEIAEANKQKVIEKYIETGEWDKLTDEQKKAFMESVGSTGKLDVQLALKFQDLQEERALRPDKAGGYLGLLDRTANFTRNHPIAGAVFNPVVMGYMGSLLTGRVVRGLVTTGAIAGGVATAGTLAFPLVLGAAAGGMIAAIKRSRNLKYDRGMEQRREALGQQGEGRRAEAMREFGFSAIAENSDVLAERIEAGDANSVRSALSLIQAERRLRAEGRPSDLLFGTSEEAERTGSNIVSRTRLLSALENFEENYGAIDGDDITERVEGIVEFVNGQDKDFESDRRKKTAGSFAFGAVVGAVSGLVAQEIADHASELIHGENNDKITAFEYILGQRPRTAQSEMYMMSDGTQIKPGEVIKQVVEMPDSHQKVEVAATLVGQGENAHFEVSAGHLPKGFEVNPSTGQITHEVAGIQGEVVGSGWKGIRSGIAERFGFDKIRASWVGHADNGTAPDGSSWSGAEQHANGTELGMDYIRNKDGSVTISGARMLGHSAYGGGHRVSLTPDKMADDIVATISPRDKQLQFDALSLDVSGNGHAETIPHELADQIFVTRGGHTELRSGFMTTMSEHLRTSSGKSRLFEISADFNDGNSDVRVPGYNEVIDFKPAVEYLPPVDAAEVVSPNAIPFDPRRPLGDVIPKRQSEQESESSPEDPKSAFNNSLIAELSKLETSGRITPEISQRTREAALASEYYGEDPVKEGVIIARIAAGVASKEEYSQFMSMTAARKKAVANEKAPIKPEQPNNPKNPKTPETPDNPENPPTMDARAIPEDESRPAADELASSGEQTKVGDTVKLTPEKIRILTEKVRKDPRLKSLSESAVTSMIKNAEARVISVEKGEAENIRIELISDSLGGPFFRVNISEKDLLKPENGSKEEKPEKGNGFEIDALARMTEEQKAALNAELLRIIDGDMTHAEKVKAFNNYLDSNLTAELADSLKHVNTSGSKVLASRLSDRNFMAYIGAVVRRIEGKRSGGE